jgi:hypothetical protein
MPRGDSYQLQGQQGGHVLNAGEGAVTGNFRWIQMVEDTVFTTITGSNLTNTADLAGITHLAGTGIGGTFTAITVASGTCIAYTS